MIYRRLYPAFGLTARNLHTSRSCLKTVDITRPQLRPPRPPRRVLESIVQPRFSLPEDNSMAARCTEKASNVEARLREEEAPGDNEVALVRHLHEKYFARARMLAILQTLSIDARTTRIDTGRMAVDGMIVRQYTTRLMGLLTQGTKYASLAPLFVSSNSYVFAEEPRYKELYTHLRRLPYYTLLAVVVDDRVLSAKQFEEIARLPSLDVIPAQIVRTLESTYVKPSRLLDSHLYRLSASLAARAQELRSK